MHRELYRLRLQPACRRLRPSLPARETLIQKSTVLPPLHRAKRSLPPTKCQIGGVQPKRPDDAAREDQCWSLECVHADLAQGCWQRKMDTSGRISFNRNYTLHQSLKGQPLWIRFDPNISSWPCWDDKGQRVATVRSLEINTKVMTQLKTHRSTAKHTKPSTKADVAPPT
jgi:hypothetical protein